jgi:hypothetical protein
MLGYSGKKCFFTGCLGTLWTKDVLKTKCNKATYLNISINNALTLIGNLVL